MTDTRRLEGEGTVGHLAWWHQALVTGTALLALVALAVVIVLIALALIAVLLETVDAA